MFGLNNQNTEFQKPKYTASNFLVGLYVALMFTAFPLYLSNYYGNVRRDKFSAFLVITAVISVLVLAKTVYDFLTVKKDKLKPNLSITDYSFFAFIIVTIISTFTTKQNIMHCIIGASEGFYSKNAGRNMGLIMFAFLFIMYLIVSKFFSYNNKIFYAIFIGISIVTLLAIVNYYYIDPLGIFKFYQYESAEMVRLNFTSTLGNKNYLSAFICVALPFSIGVAMTTNNMLMKIIANISTAIQFMGLIVATSDGGFFGLIALIFVTSIVISRKPLQLAKFFFSLTIMLLGANVLRLFDLIMGGQSKGYSGMSAVFMTGKLSFVLNVVFAVLTVLFTILHIKYKKELLPKYVFYMVLGFASFVVVLIMVIIVNYTFIDTKSQLSGFKSFLRFNDDWGTHRGFFWIRSVNIWNNDFNLWEKLFGTGPETFYYAFEPYFSELKQLYTEDVTNAAHNVYINTLITHGLLGLLAYITFIISVLIRTLINSKSNSLAFICFLVIFTYAVQDFVNIANPINTPLFFVFISIAESSNSVKNKEEYLIV